MKAHSWFLLVVSVTACASTAPQQATTPSATTRHRPRRSAVTRVLGTAAQRAAGCIPPTVTSVTVDGAFDGPTGEYRVERVQGAQPIGRSVSECIRQEFEAARVEPFSDATFAASRTFGPETEEPDGGAAGSATAASADAGESVTVSAGADASAAPSMAPPSTTQVASSAPPPSAATASTAPAGTATHASVAPRGREPPAHTVAEAGPLPRATAQACYRAVSRQDPTVGGRVRLRFTVTSDGAPANVRADTVGTPTGRAALFADAMRCIEARVRHMTFDRTSAGDVDLAITLAPSRAGGEVSIERSMLGLLAAAPGTAPATTASAPEPGAISVTGAGTASTVEPNHAAASADEMRQVSATMREHVNDVRACYQQGLSRDAALQLRLRVRFALAPSGATSDVSSTAVVTSGDGDAATGVAECMERLVRGTTFTARSGGGAIDVSVPFSFAPAAGTTTAAASSPTTPTGHIDPVRTSETIRNRTATIRECYARALASDPSLAGRVMVRFTVDMAGRVLNPASQTTTRGGDPSHLDQVAHCIEDVLESMTLPVPTGGPAAVALPFDFGPSS